MNIINYELFEDPSMLYVISYIGLFIVLVILGGLLTDLLTYTKKAFQTVKESESFLELFSGTPQDLYHVQNSIKRIKSYIEV